MPKPTRKIQTRLVSFQELFSNKVGSRGLYFPSFRRRRPGLFGSDYTSQGRYPMHNDFLKKTRGKIRVFSDIGCAIVLGAPTTLEARNALGKNSAVYAVDVKEAKLEVKKDLEKKGLTLLGHDIAKAPLPVKCDAIRFANVSNWMSQSDRRRAIVNIWKRIF